MKESGWYYKAKLEYELDASDLMDALRRGENVVIIDARSREEYEREHVAGAINIPHREMNPMSTKDIDQTALIVTYCDGIGCNASTKGAYNMSKLGYNVKELIGGIVWWKQYGYNTEGKAVGICDPEANNQCGCL